jgi:hypothetical protein
VIVVVEGPSAAGKTTWCGQHAGSCLVPETPPATEIPRMPGDAAPFWAAEGARRWDSAIGIEARSGVAVCDTDPLKLHYVWSLWRVGRAPQVEVQAAAAAYREQVVSGRLGFAEKYLVSVPSNEELRWRKEADTTRRRHLFDLHEQLGPPLEEWYAIVEAVRPGSVVHGFPGDGIASLSPDRLGRSRFDVSDYDRLVTTALRAGD